MIGKWLQKFRQEDFKIFCSSIFLTFMIFAAATALTGCEVVKYTAKCTLVQPDNCN